MWYFFKQASTRIITGFVLYTVFLGFVHNCTQQRVKMTTGDNIKSAFQISELLSTRSS